MPPSGHPRPIRRIVSDRLQSGSPQRRLRLAKPGASSTRSLRRSHPRWPKPAPRRSLKRRPIRNRQIRSSSAGKSPIARHHLRRNSPRGFLLRGFSDACLRAAPPPGDWQASETLNDSGPSRPPWNQEVRPRAVSPVLWLTPLPARVARARQLHPARRSAARPDRSNSASAAQDRDRTPPLR